MVGISPRPVFQNAFVVNDIEASIRKWVRTMGVGPFVLLENLHIPGTTYRGGPTEFRLHAALAASGDVQIELIQPLYDGPSIYRDFFKPGEEGFHHIGLLTDDIARDIDIYTRQGHALVTRGGNAGGTQFAYLDTWAASQCCVELIQADAGYMQMHAAMKEAAAGWDRKTEIFLRRGA